MRDGGMHRVHLWRGRVLGNTSLVQSPHHTSPDRWEVAPPKLGPDESAMKKFLRRFKDKLTFKDLPPPYRENEVDNEQEHREDSNDSIDSIPCDALDLLANCRITADNNQSEVEYEEIQDMGLWHSTPLAHRHKSKISLTWVLKENLEGTKLNEKSVKSLQKEDKINNSVGNDLDRRKRHNQQSNETERRRKCKSNREVRDRVVGRNEYYHNLRFKSACEEFVNQETCSDTSVGTEEYARRKHRHRHRRKKRSQSQGGKFGYDIRDLDSFLSEATIDRPGNIPVVIAYPTALYQTHKEGQVELTLPLGTVVNAVFKNQQWLYAQTPHADEGYVLYSACLPLGILPNRTSPQKKTPCWESSTDIYPRPCGNLTDNEKEQLRTRTRSESRYKPREKRLNNSCAEKNFDTLYLKTKSVSSDINRLGKENVKNVKTKVQRQTLLVVNSDFRGSLLNKTLSVQQGDVVVLVQGGGTETDVDAEWFYVRKKDGSHGFIPASIAGHGYI